VRGTCLSKDQVASILAMMPGYGMTVWGKWISGADGFQVVPTVDRTEQISGLDLAKILAGGGDLLMQSGVRSGFLRNVVLKPREKVNAKRKGKQQYHLHEEDHYLGQKVRELLHHGHFRKRERKSARE
jgi:hypothetical protein